MKIANRTRDPRKKWKMVIMKVVKVASAVAVIAALSTVGLASASYAVQPAVAASSSGSSAVLDDRFVAVTSPINGERTSGRLVVTGTGQPGRDVHILGAGGTTYAEARVDVQGKWTAKLRDNLEDFAPGTYTLYAKQLVALPGFWTISSSEFTFVVGSDDVVLDTEQVVVTSPINGERASRRLVVTGTGQPGRDVSIFGADGRFYAETQADAQGNWTAELFDRARDFAPGKYTLYARQSIVTPTGLKSSIVPFEFVVE